MRTSGARMPRFVRGPVGVGGRLSKGLRGMAGFLPYFFFGPLLTMGGLGVDFVVLLPPLLDMAHLFRICESGSGSVAASAITTAAAAVGATARLVARGAVHGLVAAGLEGHLGLLATARAGRAEHFACSAPSTICP